ncbi:SDR family NAD(P)-dependent oxidoreductase [Hoeflea ulvae]|uniref:SDR family NAD(P)-dependent oxidoreductase n=1 Tax=Hoeflea ulvae TaxID=2983764 RepID=A0ABT3YDQ2_9HYPH|nr:SDR family NAD(P)-dependent oxidoreductase [Hoeflea ulvae]MCY0093914.1 SDR family NAD(P)-dependent oxidoreductase [Hoeflea ulvae]
MASRRALVTGGSSGLGAAIVGRLLAEGYDVVVLDRDPPQASGVSVDFVDCDLSSRDQLDRTMPGLVDAGPYDLVVLNAGINATGRFETVAANVHTDLLRINAEAPMVIAARLFEASAFSQGAGIVFVSSLSHFTGYPGAASYAASKDALAIYARSMRKFARSRGVSITVAFPGPLRTGHAERHAPKGADASKRMNPDLAASLILTDALSGRTKSIPGFPNRSIAFIGRVLPKPVTALMRRLIYDRLE